jgi:hypothetical protein
MDMVVGSDKRAPDDSQALKQSSNAIERMKGTFMYIKSNCSSTGAIVTFPCERQDL